VAGPNFPDLFFFGLVSRPLPTLFFSNRVISPILKVLFFRDLGFSLMFLSDSVDLFPPETSPP